jgi:BMFP domain-containing protein YqiC
MWEGILAMGALAVNVCITVVAIVALEEFTDWPDIIRAALRGRAGRKSLAARVDDLEARLTATERKLGRPAA